MDDKEIQELITAAWEYWANAEAPAINDECVYCGRIIEGEPHKRDCQYRLADLRLKRALFKHTEFRPKMKG